MRGAQRPSTSPSKRSAPSERPAEHSDGDRSTRNAASGTKTTRFEVILHQNDLLHDDIEHQNHVDAFVGTYHTYHVSNDSQTVVDDWNHTMVSVFGNHIAPEKASIGAGAADVPRHEPARLGDRPRHEKPRERVGTGLGSAGPTARTGRAPPGARPRRFRLVPRAVDVQRRERPAAPAARHLGRASGRSVRARRACGAAAGHLRAPQRSKRPNTPRDRHECSEPVPKRRARA